MAEKYYDLESSGSEIDEAVKNYITTESFDEGTIPLDAKYYAEKIKLSDGSTLQDKYNSNELIGKQGEKGDTGLKGDKGTVIFNLSDAASVAPVGARVGDFIQNVGSTAYIIGGKTMQIGDIAIITTLSPFVVTVNGNIRGVQGVPGTNMNMELIFSGDAKTEGSSYSLSKPITNFKSLIFCADVGIKEQTNIALQHTCIPTESITINHVDDLTMYNYYFTFDTEVYMIYLVAYFTSDTVFKISILVLSNQYSRVGITKIWGVY